MLVISKVANIIELRNTTLRERASRAHGGRSCEFVALVRGEEAAMLSYEDWSDKASAFVYEIFVLPLHRRQGLGAALLSHAEQHAIQLNCRKIRLKPHALDSEPNLSRLKVWYTSLGYREVINEPEQMEKLLHGGVRPKSPCGIPAKSKNSPGGFS